MNDNIYKIDKTQIQMNVLNLVGLYKAGKLGGEKMPEDENPCLDKHSKENYLYFTLPMALNYQRNSYKLWESANKTFQDKSTLECFSPQSVKNMPIQALTEALLKYKVALQPNKQPVIWHTICTSIHNIFDDDIRNLFIQEKFSVVNIKTFIAKNKLLFPYLGGKKILNYWLYVMEQYTDVKFIDRENISVAPDTHVIQASCRLGIIDEVDLKRQDIQEIVAKRWADILIDTELCPIDVHTPLWLWSRNKFSVNI